MIYLISYLYFNFFGMNGKIRKSIQGSNLTNYCFKKVNDMIVSRKVLNICNIVPMV